MPIRNATPWVDRTLGKIWPRLEAIAPADAMPVPGEAGFEEYGCGHYGCALPTEAPNIVLKLTTDESEARLVSFLRSPFARNNVRTEGIVEYYDVVRVEGASYRRRPLYAIWREEAISVGAPIQQRLSVYSGEDWPKLVIDFKELASILQWYIKPGKADWKKRLDKVLALREWASRVAEWGDLHRGNEWNYKTRYGSWHNNPYRSAWALQQCEWIAQNMSETPDVYLIGETLDDLLEVGILLADVHINNVGQVVRADYDDPVWVITDPGHALVLDDELEFPEVESV